MPESQTAERPLNPEWARLSQMIAEEKFLWSKSEDGLSSEDITAHFNEKFRRSLSPWNVEGRLNRLKETKAAMKVCILCFFLLHSV